MKKRQILINAALSVVQILVTSGVLFILYRFLLNTIGVKQLGIWSLVLATTSATQIANLGISGSVVKFVAKYIAREENKNISAVIQTAAISVGAFLGLALLIGYPVAKWVLGLVVPEDSLPLAISVLPYAFLALWLLIITNIFLSGLDGYQRIDLRSFLLMGSAIFNLFLCFILVPAHGLLGFAYARIIQNITILLTSWFLLRRFLPLLPFLPYRWNNRIFKEIIGYGINLQIISVTIMFYEPLTKALLSKFGGLSMVGFYEMANRFVQQLKAIIISANQVLVPAIADLKEKTPEHIESVYLTSYQLLFYLALPLFSLIIVYLPIISELWIGHYERVFVIFGILLAIGWFFYTLSAPASSSLLGIGDLRWYVISHIVIAFLNIALGYLSGVFFGGIAVIIAWVFSLVVGSNMIFLSYHLKYRISLVELIPKDSRILILMCLICVPFIFSTHYKIEYWHNIKALNNIFVILFSIIIFILLWLHPMRKRLIGWISSELLSEKQRENNDVYKY